jgi:hypothetical protein
MKTHTHTHSLTHSLTHRLFTSRMSASFVANEWPNFRGYKTIDIPTGLGMCVHSFFVKEHVEKGVNSGESSSSAGMKGRTLFVGNIDYCKDRSHEEIHELMGDLFGSFGDIESVSVSEFKQHNSSSSSSKHNTRFAHVTFEKRAEMKAALTASYEAYTEGPGAIISEKWGSSSSGRSLLGKRGLAEIFNAVMDGQGFRYQDTDEIKSDVNTFLKEFDENELIAKAERERQAAEADEEGFVTVKTR